MSLKVNVGPVDPEDVLSTSGYGPGALIALQVAATATGTYAAVSGVGSTPTIAVVAGVRFYEGWDRTGDTTTWYRVRYESVTGLPPSAWSPSFQGLVQAPWYVTGADVLVQAAVTNPSAADTAWAATCASAVNGAIAHQLVGVSLSAFGAAELYRAALVDGAGAYLDRDAPHGVLSLGMDGDVVRLGADILRAAVPVLRRYSLGIA